MSPRVVFPAVDTPSSNTAGFAAAQRRLRAQFGEDVVFYAPQTGVVYPPGTPIDPQTGTPYDPTIEPDEAVDQSVTVKCDVSFTAAGPDAEYSAAGITERTHVMLIADIDDRPAIEPAVEFQCRGDMYAITSQKPDGIGGLQRYLVWGRRKA